MKVFVAGSRFINRLDKPVIDQLESIIAHESDILVGDCNGVDTAVQEFCAKRHYDRVTVYASNGRARNNVGNFTVKDVPVGPNVHPTDYYKQKDISMAVDADCGLMVWDGKSRGTKDNIDMLMKMKKPVLVFIPSMN